MSQNLAQAKDVTLEPASVAWGRENCVSVQFPTDVTGSLNAQYFDINVIGSDFITETQYYVWLDNGSSVDPAIAGKTGIQVTYSNNDTGAVIAGLAQTAIDAVANISASVSGDTVTYENDFIGKITAEDQSNAALLTFVQLQTSIGGDLGATLEGIELSIETSAFQLKSNQTGEYVLGEINQGANAGISLTLAEMTQDRWEAVVGGVAGDIFTPGGGTRLVGYGEDKLFADFFSLGGKLILHPLSKDASDLSEDIIFWRSAPKPNSINYSGTDQQGMAVEFTAYLDKSTNSKINLFAQGDWSQDVSA